MRRATHNPASQTNLLGISIHALLAESDRISEDVSYSIIVFLSTLSLRRATSRAKTTDMAKRHFYPRSPCGERRYSLVGDDGNEVFLSTLSLRRATGSTARARKEPLFLSTLSLRRATSIPFIRSSAVCIFLSTLSLRRATHT